MALPEFPIDLPYAPDVEGYSDTTSPYIQRTDFEGGNSRQRLRRSIHGRVVNMTLALSDRQKDSFEDFWQFEIAFGSARFRMPLWVGTTGRKRAGRGEWTGSPWIAHEVQIRNGSVSYRQTSPGMWAATFVLEVIREIE